MAIYDLGTASLAANGEVTGVGTTWKAPLTLIRVGATIVFKTEPVKIYTISEIISDTQINVYNPNSETVPAGTGYAILAHDGITVQGLAQDVAETLRYYQSQESNVAQAVEAFNNFDANDFDAKVSQVSTQHGDVVTIGAQVSSDAARVSADKDSASSSAASAALDKNAAAESAKEAADYAASLDTQNLLRKDLNFSDVADKALSRTNLDVYSKAEINLKKTYGVLTDYKLDSDSDYTLAFQRCLAENNNCLVPSGNFTVSGRISLSSFQSIKGVGKKSQIKKADGYNGPIISVEGSGYPSGAVSYVTMSDITIANDYTEKPNAIELINVSYINLSRVFVNGFGNNVYIRTCEGVDFTNCQFSGASDYGIYCFSDRASSGLVNSWVTLTDCLVNGNNLGLSFIDSASTVLNNVKIVNNTTGGLNFELTIQGGQRMWVSVNNCDIDSNGGNGVNLVNITEGNISGTWISGGRGSLFGHGIKMLNTYEFTIESCRIYANGNDGINASRSGKVSISSCNLSGNSGSAIYFDGQSGVGVRVIGNNITTSGSALTQTNGIIIEGGNSHCVVDNYLDQHSGNSVSVVGDRSIQSNNAGYTHDNEIHSQGSLIVKQGSSTALTINTGAVTPGSDGSTFLGLAASRWDSVWSTNGTIQTSDGRLKDIYEISENEIKAGLKLSSSMVKYRWSNKNDGKYHFGVIAQEVKLVFEEFGLNHSDYDVCIYDKESDSYAVNYAELNSFCIMALSSKLNSIT